jgi:hypothetical protein
MIFMFHDDVGEERRSVAMDVQRLSAKMGSGMLRTIVSRRSGRGTNLLSTKLTQRHD